MTAYSPIANTQIDQDSPADQTLFTALRDNPIAIAEGASGAPNLLLGVAAKTTAGGVGTPVFARSTGGADVAFGATLAGSNLVPTSAAYSVRVDDDGSGFDETTALNTGTALAGTWTCLGEYDDLASGSNINLRGATLWIRTA